MEIEEMKLTLNIQLQKILELYNVRKQLLNVAGERLEAARLNMQISDEKYRSGAINSFNYRDVQLVFLDAAFSRLQAMFNLIETHSELMRLTGGVIQEY